MFRNKIILTTLCLVLVGGTILGVVFNNFLEGFNLNWYIGVLMYFSILSTLSVAYVEDKSRKVDQKAMVNVYMLTKVVKIILSLFFITIYALVVKEGIKPFALSFVSLYLLVLIIESRMFFKIEKHLKEIKKEK